MNISVRILQREFGIRWSIIKQRVLNMSLVRRAINKAYSFFIKNTALRSAKVGKAFRCQRPFSMGGGVTAVQLVTMLK